MEERKREKEREGNQENMKTESNNVKVVTIFILKNRSRYDQIR